MCPICPEVCMICFALDMSQFSPSRLRWVLFVLKSVDSHNRAFDFYFLLGCVYFIHNPLLLRYLSNDSLEKCIYMTYLSYSMTCFVDIERMTARKRFFAGHIITCPLTPWSALSSTGMRHRVHTRLSCKNLDRAISSFVPFLQVQSLTKCRLPQMKQFLRHSPSQLDSLHSGHDSARLCVILYMELSRGPVLNFDDWDSLVFIEHCVGPVSDSAGVPDFTCFLGIALDLATSNRLRLRVPTKLWACSIEAL